MRASLLLLLLCLTSLPARGAGLQVPEIVEFELDNGIAVQLVEHATVPMAAIEIWIRAGAVDDPEGREGLASLTADALRKGAGERDAQAFAGALDFLGARFSTSVDAERTRVAMDLLSRDLDSGLDLLTDALLRPQFPEDEILKLREQLADGVKSEKENPRNVLGTYHTAHVFAGHPYGRPVGGTETSLPGLDRDAVRDFHRDHYSADRMAITIVGDIDVDALRESLARRFGELSASGAAEEVVATPDAPEDTSVLLVDKPDTPQTWFQIGGIGPSWQDLDDRPAVEIVRTILGGRFTSWLNTALRIESGLTYSAGFRIWWGSDSGQASISTFTATETTREAIDLALAQLDRLHEEGLTEADLASAKAYLRGQIPYQWETQRGIASGLAELQFHGVGRDYVDQMFERLDSVTLEDCARVTERWFPRENLRFTAIGVAAEVEDILASYGPVTVRENAAPGFAPIPAAGNSR